MLLGLVAAETIGEGEADDSAKVHVVDDVLTSVGVVQMIVACLEDVVAVGFQLELVILERLPGEGCVEIARGWDVDDSLDGVGMNGSIEVEKHMLAKEKSAVPLGLTEPFAAVEWKIIEVGILVVLIYASEGKAILPPVAYVDWGCEHQAYLVYMVEVDMLVFHLLLLVALVRKLTKFIFRVVEEETCHVSAVQNIGKREAEVS